MIRIIEQPYQISRNDIDERFEGKMVLLAYNSVDTEDGLIVAHSDGNVITENEDRNSLLEILRKQYNGCGKLVSGYAYDGSEFVCI